MSDMQPVTMVADLRQAVTKLRAQGNTIALVPTMGALHDGHLSLLRVAATQADAVVVSIFVNPLQFDRAADLDTYPRDLAADAAALAALGAHAPTLVFTPTAEEMYPQLPPLTTVQVAGLTERLCGATRPGHFDGVATVVTKLFHMVQPDVAVFGRKDRQQLEVIRRLVSDLNLPIKIADAPTLRDADGVAMSSRNATLTVEERQMARAIPDALVAAVLAARDARQRSAPVTPDLLSAAAAATLGQRARTDAQGADAAVGASGDQPRAVAGDTPPRFVLDYLDVVDPLTLTAPVEETDDDGPADVPAPLLVAIAAFVGSVRLIDNVEVGHHADEQHLLAHLGSNPTTWPRVGRRSAGIPAAGEG